MTNIRNIIILHFFLFCIVKANTPIYCIPISGKENKDWFIANYIDKNNNEGSFKDFKNGFMTYDGHTGIDFTLKDFITMKNGISVKVSRSGIVESLHDGEFDYQTSCDRSKWNYIKIRHKDNSYAYYGHLKKWSIVVKIGDIVDTGQIIAQVGSSGCSTHPHLHFEIRNNENKLIDIFQNNLINFSYHYPKNAYIFEQGVTYQDDVNLQQDYYHFTPGKLSKLKSNKNLTFWLKVIGLKLGDKIYIKLFDDNNIIKQSYTIHSSKNYSYSYWYINLIPLKKGKYKIKAYINKKQKNTIPYSFEL